MLSGIRYAVSEIQQNYDRPGWWRTRFASHILGRLQNWFCEQGDRTGIFEEDWDVLIVLDACRADLFETTVDTNRFDRYEVRQSLGSATDEWSKANFSGQAHSDTIYVTGNPVVSRSVNTAFYKFIEPWRDGFDEELGTVPPGPVTEAAIEAYNSHPEKRLIVHYLQPHYPFIKDSDLQFTTFQGTDDIEVQERETGAADIWEAVEVGLVGIDEAWEAYRRNLEYVMDGIEPLLDAVKGKVVITSDHGNAIGERACPIPIKLYGHPSGVHHPVLTDIPWAVIEGDRGQSDRIGLGDDVEEKLEHLGYV